MTETKNAAPVGQSAAKRCEFNSITDGTFCLPSTAYVKIHESLEKIERDTQKLLTHGNAGNKDIFVKWYSDNLRDIKEEMLKGHFEGK